MYYPFECTWSHDLTRWTYAEDERLIFLRTRHYDQRFKTSWPEVKLNYPHWWQDIADDKIFQRRRKDKDDCYERFCFLVDKFMELRKMKYSKRPYWEHYKMMRWFYHDCHDLFE